MSLRFFTFLTLFRLLLLLLLLLILKLLPLILEFVLVPRSHLKWFGLSLRWCGGCCGRTSPRMCHVARVTRGRYLQTAAPSQEYVPRPQNLHPISGSTQTIRHVHTMLNWCWASVADDGPTLIKHCVYTSRYPAKNVDPVLGRCWLSVRDGGQSLAQYWANVWVCWVDIPSLPPATK